MSENKTELKPLTVEQSVRQRLSLMKQEIGTIPQSGFNKFGNYHHSTIDDIHRVVRPLLGKYFLDVRMNLVKWKHTYLTTKERAKNGEIFEKESQYIVVEYEIGFSEEEPQLAACMVPFAGPQTFGSAMSFIQKQFLDQRLQLDSGGERAPHMSGQQQQSQHQSRQAQNTQQKPPVNTAPPPKPAAEQNQDSTANLINMLIGQMVGYLTTSKDIQPLIDKHKDVLTEGQIKYALQEAKKRYGKGS